MTARTIPTAPLCGSCEDGWITDPETCLPILRCPCRLAPQRAVTTAVADANPGSYEAAVKVIRDVAETSPEVDANTCRDRMRAAQVKPSTIGAAFSAAIRDGIIAPVDYVQSTEATTRHRVLRYRSLVFRGSAA